MAHHVKTYGQLIHWQYAKLISHAAVGDREAYGFVMATYKRLQSKEISSSAILRENKMLVQNPNECAYCRSKGDLQWEHIIPRSKGGPDTIDNLVLSCGTCNRLKGDKDPIQWYGTERIGELPRLVLGKFLKLVYDAHAAAGTLDLRFDDPWVALENLSFPFGRPGSPSA